MKQYKTRIKIIENNAGEKKFIAQVKEMGIVWTIAFNILSLIFSFRLSRLPWSSIDMYGRAYDAILSLSTPTLNSMESAKNAIDLYRKNELEKQQREHDKKIKKIAFEKYP